MRGFARAKHTALFAGLAGFGFSCVVVLNVRKHRVSRKGKLADFSLLVAPEAYHDL